LKDTILEAIAMPKSERRARMRSLRRRVLENDVAKWSSSFLATLTEATRHRLPEPEGDPLGDLEWTIERPAGGFTP